MLEQTAKICASWLNFMKSIFVVRFSIVLTGFLFPPRNSSRLYTLTIPLSEPTAKRFPVGVVVNAVPVIHPSSTPLWKHVMVLRSQW
ncbi:hypothetical protein Hanom_Chr02g00162831 [Helianthus anomalus]